MTPSEKCLELVKRFEGCKLKAYLCPANVWTIGYGTTGPEIKEGLEISQDDAENYLRRDLVRFGEEVDAAVKVNITQSQFDALVSFVYNVGPGAFRKSTMLRKLNAGDYLGAALEFPKWNRGGGVVLNGLVRRRAAEQAMFQLGA